jgi:transposase InsO family protein
MPWKEATTMSQREGFIALARQEGANISALCRQFGISRKTGYKWLKRFRESDSDPVSLEDRSRRPHRSPGRTALEVERAILDVRDAHPAWGGRKIRAYLQQHGHQEIPNASTVTAILRRCERIDPQEAEKHRPFQSFEMAYPNQLWQMDFKGHFPLADGRECYPLVVLDDCSRFLLGLDACADETRETVQPIVTELFRRYGLPLRMLMDNGNPWGNRTPRRVTRFEVWLFHLDIEVSHGAFNHPQTQGKAERLHRTLKTELLFHHHLSDYAACQRMFDSWRTMYNTERPHEALAMATPQARYYPSSRPFPEILPKIVYDEREIVRKADDRGRIKFRHRRFQVGKALASHNIAIRPTSIDGVFDVYLGRHRVAEISFLDDNGSTTNV